MNPMYELWSYHDNRMNPMYEHSSCMIFVLSCMINVDHGLYHDPYLKQYWFNFLFRTSGNYRVHILKGHANRYKIEYCWSLKLNIKSFIFQNNIYYRFSFYWFCPESVGDGKILSIKGKAWVKTSHFLCEIIFLSLFW